MPDTDMANITVTGIDTGHARTTQSWLLGKLLHDLNDKLDQEMEKEMRHMPPNSEKASNSMSTKEVELHRPEPHRPEPHRQRQWEALRISVFETIDDPHYTHGVPHRDFLCSSGRLSTAVEGREMGLPEERGSSVVLSQGNGSRHAILILGKRGVGLDLEILSRGTRTSKRSPLAWLLIVLLTANWIILLITASGLKLGTWYLLAIGAIGSMQNIVVAAAQRQPSALAEEEYPGAGISLIPVFFPGSMRVKGSDIEFWQNVRERHQAPDDDDEEDKANNVDGGDDAPKPENYVQPSQEKLLLDVLNSLVINSNANIRASFQKSRHSRID
ncbi:hypothetical protein H072_4023 [Dactylellina haptotyla CBS 200.50]|uniref:Uncharacterized protein n=1 Tax=Dactylellina haptotyla (strain CBS 200.50) TaxID=1284197 RepID=S8AGM7_DACHA|nr:hypothetical protein H072_4023 [Dactylellina haptotyla CBS 200.50]